jgi:iron complex transport system ATP-binding protein
VAARDREEELAVKLEARDLAFGYRGRPVGRNVSVGFGAGEIVCLLGPNGGGKTTLFRTLLGLLPSQGGQVLLDGAELGTLSRREVAKRIGYVPQAHTGYFPFTVRDVVLMGRTAHLPAFAGPSRRDRAIADEALERLGLAHLAEAIYTRISGGERQLTLIARALAQATPLLVMDEPTASLDFGNQVRVLGEVMSLAQSGIGILLSTHDPDQAFQCAARVALLRGGELIAQGAPPEVLTRERLRVLYGVDVGVVRVAALDAEPRYVCVPRVGRA